MRISTLKLSRAAVIAALYTAICFFFKPLSYGMIQFRLSEILCVLPILLPEAIPGLFIGCVIANILGGASIALLDATLGSLTTLLAAFLTRIIYVKSKSLILSFIPPVVLNALIVGTYIPFIYPSPTQDSIYILVLYSILSVFIGQLVVIYALGFPFAKALIKTNFLNVK